MAPPNPSDPTNPVDMESGLAEFVNLHYCHCPGLSLTAGTFLEMAISIIGRGTIDCSHRERLCVVVKILCIWDVVVFGVFGLLNQTGHGIADKHIAGIYGRHCS